jgi:hypothetical protein
VTTAPTPPKATHHDDRFNQPRRFEARHATFDGAGCATRGYYDANRHTTSFAYTDHVIDSPDVPFFRDERWQLVEERVGALGRHGPCAQRG